MYRFLATVLTSVAVCACGGSTTSPSAPAATATLTFDALNTNGAAVALYSERGYNVSAVPGDWISVTTYGHPAPFIEFVSKASEVGEVHVTANGGAPFRFVSVDLYSSVTPIPYTISGVRNSSIQYTLSDTVPNTFGNFRTITNPHAGDVIETLTISLTNPVTFGGQNPVGLDNIVLTR